MSAPSKHLKTFLVVSLLLNVFLIGSVGGGLYQWWGQPKPMPAAAGPAVNQRGLRQVLAQLPEARRHELRKLIRQTRNESQPLILAGREARLGVMRQLQASTLDRNALEADLGRAREADSGLRMHVDNTLAEFASTLPQDERQKLAESMYFRGQGNGAKQP
ncbi:MAG: periplasmic heavy metal sensor [Pseudomonas sp.]|uniref:periplasmic heavy metal sensor n=1 Tax=Pseudomonas abieticivorans TaxID=2931382 RepID=UPI0020BF6E97|nr:periplasmic heavy metal sensor [Pseudomonas sp. PIA16]MDE1166695.1 periplasmic heavy metal sensor [Pseudomonas sp.]